MIKAVFNFVLAFLLLISSIGFCLYRVVTPNFVGNQARSIGLYERLSNDLAAIIPSNMLEGLDLSNSDVKKVVTSSIDSGTFYDFFAKESNSYIDWLTGRTDSLSFSYPLTTVKANLADNLTSTWLADYDNLSLCTSAQLKTWKIDGGEPACRLPTSNTYSSDVPNLFAAQSQVTVAQLPDTYVAGSPSSNLLKARTYTIQSLKVIELAWAVTIGFILLYFLLFRSRAFLSLAFTFLLAGLFEVAFGLIGWDYMRKIVTDSLQSMNQATASAIVDLVSAGLEVLKTTLGNLSIISLATGAVFLVLGVVSRFRHPLRG